MRVQHGTASSHAPPAAATSGTETRRRGGRGHLSWRRSSRLAPCRDVSGARRRPSGQEHCAAAWRAAVAARSGRRRQHDENLSPQVFAHARQSTRASNPRRQPTITVQNGRVATAHATRVHRASAAAGTPWGGRTARSHGGVGVCPPSFASKHDRKALLRNARLVPSPASSARSSRYDADAK